MSRLFLSHSSQDNASAIALCDWLAKSGWEDVFLDLDPERGIAAGERWERALHEATSRCEAVAFLISRAWLGSEWCRRELTLAQRLNKRLFGILIEDLPLSDLPTELIADWQVVRLGGGSDHQMFRAALPGGGEAHVTFSAAGLARLKAGLTKAGLDPSYFSWPPEADPERAPWRGMQPLEAEDAGVFFGREAPLVEVMDRLRGLAEGAEPRFLVILGSSGSGKSSFLRAGLLPRLARDEAHFLPLLPLRAERAAITSEGGGLLTVLERACIGLRISRAELAGAVAEGTAALTRILNRLATASSPNDARPPTLVLAVDQAEELFNPAGREEAEAFLTLLAGLLSCETTRLILIATIRSDAYEALQTAKALEGLRQQTFSLPPLPRGQWVSIIEGPVARMAAAGRPLRLDPALTASLLTETESGAGRDALPLLAFTLGRLWRDHGGKGALTLADYRATGGIAGAIDAAVERAFARADSDPMVPREREARLALLRRGLIPWLAGIDPETGSARRLSARLSDIPPEARPLIEHLVDERLLSKEQTWRPDGADLPVPESDPVIEPVHEALLRQWGALRGWLDDDFARLSALEALRRATRDWDANTRDPAWLSHRAGRLEDAERLADRPDLWARLDAADRAYLAGCRQVENTARDERERQLRAIADGERRRAEAEHARRRLAMIGGGLAGMLAIVSVLAGIYGFRQAEEARVQEQTALVAAGRADAEAETARKAAEEALWNETVALAGLSRAAAAEGRFSDALKLVLATWPREGDAERPALQRALDALSIILPETRPNQVTVWHDGPVSTVVFSPDGNLVLTSSSDLTARLWNTSTGRSVGQPMRHEGRVEYAAFSPDGGLVLTTSSDFTARLWDTSTGISVGQPMRHENEVNSAEFSPDGSLVVTASGRNYRGGSAQLWDAATGRPIGEPMHHEDAVISAAFSPDQSLLVTASNNFSTRDYTARLWDVANGVPIGEPMSHGDRVTSTAFSPDGRLVLTASHDNTAQLWEVPTGRSMGEPMRHENQVNLAAFSPDAGLILTVSSNPPRFGSQGHPMGPDRDFTARLWDAASGRQVGEPMLHEGSFGAVAFSPNGRLVITSADGTARLWDAVTGTHIGAPMRHENHVNSVAFSPDGRLAVTGSHDRTARIWDVATGSPLNVRVHHDDQINSVAFSSDGRLMVTASDDRSARIWDAATGSAVGEPMRHEREVRSAVFSPDGRLVVTASDDRTARIWEVATSRPVGEPIHHESRVISAAFSPDGRTIVTASRDGNAQIWNAETGRRVAEPLHHEGSVVNSAAFSPDGSMVVTASTAGSAETPVARLWNAETGILIGEFMPHEGDVVSAAFSSEGRLVVTASQDRTARIWEAVTGRPAGEPMRHEGLVRSAAFSPNDRLVLTVSGYIDAYYGGADGQARLWDATTGMSVVAPLRHPSEVSSAAFSPDGRLVMTAYNDGTTNLWDFSTLEPGGVWEIACARLGNDTGLREVEERYGLNTLVPICGANAPFPVDRTLLR